MAMAEESNSRIWEGKTAVELASINAERVWCVLEDFCNMHKWFPAMETCYKIQGVDGKPGLIRYSAGTAIDRADPERKKRITKWAKEKVLVMDPAERCLSYEVVESNMGFKSYVATIKVLPVINGGDEIMADQGCRIEWSFVCDPVEGRTFESFYSFIQSSLQSLANKIELTFSDTHQV